MLICKIFLRKFIHTVSGIMSFDCHCYYSDTQQHSTCKLGNAQKRKMHVQLERLHLQEFLSHKSFAQCITLKKNRKHFHHYTTYDYRKEVQKAFYATKGVVWRQENHFSQKCLQIQDFCWQMSQFMTKQTETIIFRSPNFSDACIQ